MMKNTFLSFALASAAFAAPLSMGAQSEVVQLADSIVKYQLRSGGWCKNQKWLAEPDMKVLAPALRTGIGSTIDNGATIGEMRSLVKAVAEIDRLKNEGSSAGADLDRRASAYKESFKRGIAYLLEMQYPNGGFPQFYPRKEHKDYSTEITFNDNAMYNVLVFLKEISSDGEMSALMQVDRKTMKRCAKAYERGIRCVLDCQIRVDGQGRVVAYGSKEWKSGRRTVWCQQHDEVTLLPAKARAYELPSYTGFGETCALLNLLMDIESPSDEVEEAIRCGVEWLKQHAIEGMVLETFVNEDGKKDRRLVRRPGAPLLWARYYDLEEAKPYFCDRDGVPRRELSDVGYERRTGYAWVGNGPAKVIQRYEQYAGKKK